MKYVVGYIINFVIAALLSIIIYQKHWWLPALIFPLVYIIGNIISTTSIEYRDKYRKITESIIGPVIILYHIGTQMYIFYINLDVWYGLFLGLMAGYMASPFIGPKRW